ncbi:TPA: hypothetical protein ACLNQ0_003708, partial [Vibrio cholerae O1]
VNTVSQLIRIQADFLLSSDEIHQRIPRHLGLPQNGQLCTYTNMSAGLMKMANTQQLSTERE